MRTRKEHLEFANFICKFGDKNLLDGLQQVVLPAIFSGKPRKYSKTAYYLIKPTIVLLTDRSSGVTFELVKSTRLDRDQTFDPSTRTLTADEASMPSAPSAIALLILDDHRLVYFPKTRYAPTLKELESTCNTLFKQQWQIWIHGQVKGLSGRERTRALQRVKEQLPSPKVEVVPLPSSQSIENALRQFSVVKQFSVVLVDTNQEYDPNEFFKKLRAEKDALKAQRTRVEHSSRGAEGLSKTQLKKDVKAATQQGSARVTVKGTDGEGKPLSQQNEDLRVTVPISLPEKASPAQAARPMHRALKRVIDEGLIKPAKSVDDNTDRARDMVKKWDRDRE